MTPRLYLIGSLRDPNVPAVGNALREFGFMLGSGKKGYIYLPSEPSRWDVMARFATGVHYSIESLAAQLRAAEGLSAVIPSPSSTEQSCEEAMTYADIQKRVFQTARDHGFYSNPMMALATSEELSAYSWLNVEAEVNPQAAAMVRFIKKVGEEMKLLTIDQKLLLTVGELVEAQNELRNGHPPTQVYYDGDKPEGFPVEIADAHIRLMNLESSLDLDGEMTIIEKDEFNQRRPFKHGKKF